MNEKNSPTTNTTAREEQRRSRQRGLVIVNTGEGKSTPTPILAMEQWKRCREVLRNGSEDVVVLDEFTYTVAYGWVPAAEVVGNVARRQAAGPTFDAHRRPQYTDRCRNAWPPADRQRSPGIGSRA